MLGTNTAAFLKPFGVPVEVVEVQDGTQGVNQVLAIVSAPNREIGFSGVPVESEDFTMLYATADLVLAERQKVSVMGGPYVGKYVTTKVEKSADGVFSTAKLRKV